MKRSVAKPWEWTLESMRSRLILCEARLTHDRIVAGEGAHPAVMRILHKIGKEAVHDAMRRG